MLYDGDCPLCMREVNMLQERNKSYQSIKFVDISSEDYSAQDNQGLDYETVMYDATGVGLQAGHDCYLTDVLNQIACELPPEHTLSGSRSLCELLGHTSQLANAEKVKESANIELDSLLLIGFVTFFLSSVLDNLTTTIIMVSLLRKLVPSSEYRKLLGVVVVIAANAGGAWTPIGDVTTAMLWIHGQISTLQTMKLM